MSEPDTSLKQRDEWMKAILASTLGNAVQCVALRLALYLNIKTGRCDPSYGGLAAALGGVSERTVIRAIGTLEAKGWIEIKRTLGGRKANGRGGNTNKFVLLPPPERVTQACHPSEPDKGDIAVSPLRVTNPAPKGDKNGSLRVTELCHPNREENREEEQRTYEQSALRAPMCAHEHEPGDFNIPETEQRKALAQAFAGTDFGLHEAREAEGAKNVDQRSCSRLVDWPDDYREQFWTLYPHKVGKKRAFDALARLRRKPDRPTWPVLMDGLTRSLSYNGWLGLKFPNPENWIKDERWNDRPAH